MGDLTEVEIFDCMIDNLRKAVGHCHDLATKPLKGVAFMDLRKELKLVEGCCRQAGAWRQDTRWYELGMVMEEAHQRSAEWLRGVKNPVTGHRHLLPEGMKHPLFVKLAENLESLLTRIRDLRLKATGRMGAILPVPREGPHRQTKDAYSVALPDGMERRSNGLILPVHAATPVGVPA